jgi:hypothetical protein
MLDAASAEALTRRFLLGMGRHAASPQGALGGLLAPDDPKSALKALALLGQRSRFRRPAARGVSTPEERLFADDRTIVPEPARALLLSLLSGKGGAVTDAVPLAIVDALNRRHLRLHPFDLPRLDEFVKVHGEDLGAAAIAWMERHAKAATDDVYSFVDTIDETNWRQARPAQRAKFIRSLRMMDAPHARALVDGAFAHEQAPVRFVLVKALAENLSPADGPFLEGLAQDRAPSVREAAEGLLARLPGSALAAKRLADCLSRIKQTKGGLLRRSVVLQLDYPATVKEPQREGWAIATFGTIGLDDFASGLALSVDELASAAAGDPVLATVLALQAARAMRYDLLARLVRDGAATVWAVMVQSEDLNFSTPESIAAWAAAAVQPDLWSEMPDFAALMRLYAKIHSPLPAETGQRLLACKAWRACLATEEARLPPPTVFATVVALLPSTLRAALRADLAPLPAEFTARALTAMTLLDVLEGA